jgi:hypothetical protein
MSPEDWAGPAFPPVEIANRSEPAERRVSFFREQDSSRRTASGNPLSPDAGNPGSPHRIHRGVLASVLQSVRLTAHWLANDVSLASVLEAL